ncbi:MAG: hypothetical protein JJLCMIEE_01592 [Acidimicrobiales bacterium]|nr:MAG: AAA family ATPase [Actinomycetota bacterium]MBV6508528.1 hypothetical protein [Acidimicrobiales bacterium]RIK05156.1 MAG: AAA family ATPase [Acidobacteriota bacterium]
MRELVEVGRGGPNQARFERDVIWDTMLSRLSQLELGDHSLCFGRIDRHAIDGPEPEPEGDHADLARDNGGNGGHAEEQFYIGRLAVSDSRQEPVVVDWRAPVAEPFYRATGREPMGLLRRRHFATRGRELLDIEDEFFGEAALELDDGGVTGHGALMSALEESRTGKLSDIVATIQGEQDEVIRSELPGVLVVQGGPGTGKTVVALHRAAYLLYTHRFPLEGQGVLVVGPNRLFLGYIDQVLPSLGEAGVELAVLGDLLAPAVRVQGYDPPAVGRVKGDLRMTKLVAKAVRDRERPLRCDLALGYGLQTLRFTVDQSLEIVTEARRRFRSHNAARRFVEERFFDVLAASGRGQVDPKTLRERTRRTLEIRKALEWMWPVLSPAQLLHDLFGSPALLALAAGRHLDASELTLLYRPRAARADDVVWTRQDVPLLDEARARLGPRPAHREEDELRTYGHIVIDEAQDLSPMELRVLKRRSLNGSMTIVGDIAQATGAWAHEDWESILEHLPDRRPPRRAELTIGYRVPGPSMELAARVLREAAPDLRPPRSIREEGDNPVITPAVHASLAHTVAGEVQRELEALSSGTLAVIAPESLVADTEAALEAAGVDFGHADRHGLEHQVTLVPVGLVKGLELDACIVVEPAAILTEEAQGPRALYVALTRATKRLGIVHAEALPPVLAEPLG